MKSDKNSGSQSAMKRIIPAVAMFALSAVMLSSSTYAWFTMNKEVKMTGLSMSAAAGSGMEISLACLDKNGNIEAPASVHPEDNEDEKGWNSSVVVGEYYEKIGKLKPASSVNGENFYDAKNASSGGGTATEFDDVTSGGAAKATLRDPSLLKSGTVAADDTNEGYYVDIPVYLRTNKVGESTEKIYCKLKIKNKDTGDLYNAVRVAFIPITSGTGSTTKIFGVDDTYYDGGAASATDAKSPVTVVKSCVSDTNDFDSITGAESGLNIPLADAAGNYGHLDFKVRVWIEGESESCSDKTSGQNWNIDLAFAMGEFSVPTP